MDFHSASSDAVTISRATAEQALEALDRAQKILSSERNLNHAEVLAAYQALRGAVNPLRLPSSVNATEINDLLIRAACAAGIELDLTTPSEGGFRAKQNGEWVPRWAPHLDDGDSRRLEVALSMHVAIGDFASDASLSSGKHATVHHNGNPCAATRMAVLRAAAQHCS